MRRKTSRRTAVAQGITRVGKHAGMLQYGHGDRCSSCGKTDMECWESVKAASRPDSAVGTGACCSACGYRDTHGISMLTAQIRRAMEARRLVPGTLMSMFTIDPGPADRS